MQVHLRSTTQFIVVVAQLIELQLPNEVMSLGGTFEGQQ